MSTKNPKVSAYIPQHIFDRFQSFCKEKGLSMSQATAVVFAGYFEIEPEVNHLSGLLADRIGDLELKLSELSYSSSNPIDSQKALVSELKSVLLKEIESSISELQKTLFDRLESELKSSLQKEQPLSSSLSEPHPKTFDSMGNGQLGLLVEVKSLEESDPEKLSGSAPKKLASSGKPKDVDDEIAKAQKVVKTRVKSRPTQLKEVADGRTSMSTKQLAEHLKVKENTVTKAKSAAKKKNDAESFTNWSRKANPEGYGWEYRSDSSLFYKVAH